ncbi:MAG: FkbM family methyltransferase [Gemmatimonadetes bacterium]|nr:FkbM family methyltransferase [Gemmatimonadota bacterium]
MIPVVLFAYRRADLLRRTLASLRANDVPMIYAFSDGARDASVAADVAAVRAELRTVDWTRITIVESPVNLGVSESEQRGITRVLAEHEMAVIVEEDLESVPGTYAFLCTALTRYRDVPQVMGVTAWTHPSVTPPGVTQPYFTGRMSGLMWGTWRRAWDGMLDATALERRDECLARGIDPSRFGRDLMDSPIHEQQLGTWDIRFNLHMLARGGLFLFPATSMVQHIGYDERATNSPHAAGWEPVSAPAPAPESIVWPSDVREQPGSAERWRLAIDGPPVPLVRRLARRTRLGLAAWFKRWWEFAGRTRGHLGWLRSELRLERVRLRLWNAPAGATVTVGGLRLRITDGPNAFMQYKDEFVRRNYAFQTTNPAPFVIDGGANIGMFSLATRRDHPRARIVAFEPDPALFHLLRENLSANGAGDVRLVHCAIGAADGEMAFASDGQAGGALSAAGGNIRVKVEPLSRYVTEEVDFLKLNIEGAEFEVLHELAASGKLRSIRSMVFEYHGWYGGPQRLGAILDLLDAHGFRYFVHDLDEQTNAATKPVFQPPAPGMAWFALVYAWREERP